MFLTILCVICLVACGNSKEEEIIMELGELQWPEHELVKMLPVPVSTVGEVQWESEDEVNILVAETTEEEYLEYVSACSNAGFSTVTSEGSGFYYANNTEGYRLSLFFQNDENTMIIYIEAPLYKVEVGVECVENILFSKYDVVVYVDYMEVGTLDHGATDIFDLELEEGTHTLTLEKEDDSDVDGSIDFSVTENVKLSYKISCTSDQIEIEKNDVDAEETTDEAENKETTEAENESEKLEEPQKTEEPAEIPIDSNEENLTVDNCAELAEILMLKDNFDSSIKAFAQKYDGRIIEFDGNTAYVSTHENYNTRFDYLIYAGDYSETSVEGPSFQFEDVSYYDLNLTGDNVPDSFGVGLNIHIVAEIIEYDDNTGLFKLDPVSITMR